MQRIEVEVTKVGVLAELGGAKVATQASCRQTQQPAVGVS
jgi:hypothetical protein